MSTSARTVAWRLTVEGDQIAVQKMEAVGRSARKAVEPVPAILKGVSTASHEFQDKLSDLSGEVGVAGRTLSAMGPIGLATAATLGALALAAHEAFSKTREAQEFADSIESMAQRLRLSTDAFQELVAAGHEYNLTQDQVMGGLGNLRQTVNQFVAGVSAGRGTGRLFAILGLTREDLAIAGSFEQQIKMIAEALSKIKNQDVREGVAGRLGVAELLPMLQGGGLALDELQRKARDAGHVMDASVVKAGADANREYENLSDTIDKKMKAAFIGLSPVVLAAKSLFVDLQSVLADIVQSLLKIENRSSDALRNQLRAALTEQSQLQKLQEKFRATGNELGQRDVAAQLSAVQGRIDAIMAELQKRIRDSQSGSPETAAAKNIILNGGRAKIALPPSQEDERAQRERDQAKAQLDQQMQREQALADRRTAFINQLTVADQRAQADRINAENAADVEMLRNKAGYYQAQIKQSDDARDAEIATIRAQADAQIQHLNRLTREQIEQLDRVDAAYKKVHGAGLPTYAGDLQKIKDDAAAALAQIESGARAAAGAAGERSRQDHIQITREAAGALAQLADTLTGPLDRALKDVGASEMNRFTDTLVAVGTGARDAGQAVGDMVDSILADLLRLEIQRDVTAPLSKALDGFISAQFGGGHATGGGTMPGLTYRVNEQGGMPETFMNSQGTGYVLSSPASLANVVNLVRRALPAPVVAMTPGAPPKVEVHNHGEPLAVARQSYDPASNTTRVDLKKDISAAGAADVRQGGYDGAMSDRFGIRPAARRRQ